MNGMRAGDWITLLLAIAFLAMIVVGIVLVVRALTGSGTGSPTTGGDRAGDDRHVREPHRETPEDLVRRRYAAGEIRREEYQQTLRDLGA